MTLYKDWSPTPHDAKGLNLPDRQDWIVAPVILTRDTSEAVELSNWEAIQGILDDANADYETHRFRHWGPGWFEIILVHPDGAEVVADIQRRLEDYPVLDEMAMSEIEMDQYDEDWSNFGRDDFLRALNKAFPDFDDAIEAIGDDDGLHDLYRLGSERSGREAEYMGHEGWTFNINAAVGALTVADIDKATPKE